MMTMVAFAAFAMFEDLIVSLIGSIESLVAGLTGSLIVYLIGGCQATIVCLISLLVALWTVPVSEAAAAVAAVVVVAFGRRFGVLAYQRRCRVALGRTESRKCRFCGDRTQMWSF